MITKANAFSLIMLNNLKAFIRQGKQASDIKPKQPAPDKYETNQTQHQKEMDSFKKSILSDPKKDVHVEISEKHEPGLKENVLADHHITAIQGGYSSQQNQSPHSKQDYSEAVDRIVKEELEERQNRRKYPNLANYEMLDKMGEGAFSVVYKARHKISGRLVAIKVLRKYQMDTAQRQAVFKEVIIMRQLSHTNVVQFLEFIEHESYFYIVQELIEGGEIFGAIVNYTYLSENLARHVIYQVAKATRYLHEEVGVVHRDIKPENILFQPINFVPSLNPISKLRRSDDPKAKKDEGEFFPGFGGGGIGTVKLADFGLSKQIWEHNTKTPCGTVGYTAPEIVRDERYSKEVDMWAIGCVLYTFLCGFPPFYDERIESLTEKVAKGEFTFLAPWWDEISDEAKYCVSRLLTVNPKNRYTIEEFLQDPWILKVHEGHANSELAECAAKSTQLHQLSNYNRAAKFSPGALALREAFDISAAVHRMGEESNLNKQGPRSSLALLEEDEDGDCSDMPKPDQIPRDMNQLNGFALDLKGASILGRRKNKIAVAC